VRDTGLSRRRRETSAHVRGFNARPRRDAYLHHVFGNDDVWLDRNANDNPVDPRRLPGSTPRPIVGWDPFGCIEELHRNERVPRVAHVRVGRS
jgi:hypothetical protein